jgi:hypothetical protein
VHTEWAQHGYALLSFSQTALTAEFWYSGILPAGSDAETLGVRATAARDALGRALRWTLE